jgi:hypothetical protein
MVVKLVKMAAFLKVIIKQWQHNCVVCAQYKTIKNFQFIKK